MKALQTKSFLWKIDTWGVIWQNVTNPEEMGSNARVSVWSGGQSPPWNSRMFHFGFTDSPHPHRHETRGWDTTQATSFFTRWLLLFFQENFVAKVDLYKIMKNHRFVKHVHSTCMCMVQTWHHMSLLHVIWQSKEEQWGESSPNTLFLYHCAC